MSVGLLLVGSALAQQAWVTPSVTLPEATAALEQIGVTTPPQRLSDLESRLIYVDLNGQHCPVRHPVESVQAMRADAEDAMLRFDFDGAVSHISAAIDGMFCLTEVIPPSLGFSILITAAEIRTLAAQADGSARHRSEQLAALNAAASLPGEPPLTLDPELSKALLRERQGLGLATVRVAGQGDVYWNGRLLEDAPVTVREGRHVVQLVVDGEVVSVERVDVEAGEAVLVWGSPGGATPMEPPVRSALMLEKTGQSHMMLGPFLSAGGGPRGALLVSRSETAIVVWAVDGDRLTPRLRVATEPPAEPEVILPDHPYGVRFVGMGGMWLSQPGVGGGLSGWVGLSERTRLSLSLGATSATSTWTGDGQPGGAMPVTLGLRRRGATWEIGPEVGAAYTIRLSEQALQPMVGLTAGLTVPPTTSAALHLQLSGGWMADGAWAGLSAGVALR